MVNGCSSYRIVKMFSLFKVVMGVVAFVVGLAGLVLVVGLLTNVMFYGR